LRGVGHGDANDLRRQFAEDTIIESTPPVAGGARSLPQSYPPFWKAEREHQDYLEGNPGG
jgi:peptide methionine sulfoxide reductase MsrA